MEHAVLEYDSELEVGKVLETLAPRQREFWKQLESGKSPAQSYKAAYKPKTNHQLSRKAHDMMKSQKIQALIQYRRVMLAQQFGITSANILGAYANLSFFDAREFYNENGTLKHPRELSREQAMAISGYDVEEIHLSDKVLIKIKKLRFINRKESLDSLAKTQGLFLEDKDPENKKKTYVVNVPTAKTVREWNEEHPPLLAPTVQGAGNA